VYDEVWVRESELVLVRVEERELGSWTPSTSLANPTQPTFDIGK